jgi:hypothetical protein
LSVVVAAGREDEIQWTLPPSMTTFETTGQPGKRRWDLAIQPGKSPPASVGLTVTSAGEVSESWPVPRVEVRFGPGNDLVGSEILSIESDQIALTEMVGFEHTGTATWRSVGRSWRASVSKSVGVGRGESVRIPSAAIQAFRSGQTWAYRGRYRVLSAHAGPLRIVPPAGSRISSVRLNGTAIGLIEDRNGETLLALPSGSHELALHWSGAAANWQPARIEGPDQRVVFNEVSWTIFVPPGMRIEPSPSAVTEPAAIGGLARDVTDAVIVASLGCPHRFRLPGDESLSATLSTSEPQRTWWPLAAAGGILLVVLALLIVAPMSTAPEQAAGLAAVACLTLGPQAAIFWLVPAWAVAWRIRRIFVAPSA